MRWNGLSGNRGTDCGSLLEREREQSERMGRRYVITQRTREAMRSGLDASREGRGTM